jgi:prevent-host-death family protein
MWEFEQAKASFSRLLRRALAEGPQVITRRGVPIAVLVSMQEWNTLRKPGRPSLKALLLAPRVQFEKLPIRRGSRRRRSPLTQM